MGVSTRSLEPVTLWFVQAAIATENSQLQKLAILEQQKIISEFSRNRMELLVHWLDLRISSREYNRHIVLLLLTELMFPNWFMQAGWQVKYKAGHSAIPTFCQQPPYMRNKETRSFFSELCAFCSAGSCIKRQCSTEDTTYDNTFECIKELKSVVVALKTKKGKYTLKVPVHPAPARGTHHG